MKRSITLIIITVLCAVSLFAQAPEKFSYQAVVRNASNTLVTDAQVGVRVSILQGSASGNAVYVETHTATTNTNGLLTIEIGGGSNQQGTLAGIDWANGLFFLKTETDPAGGTNYTITSTQQLLSVPYALYSKEAGNGFSGDYNDLTNRPQIPQSVSELANDANYITMDSVPTNVSAFNNDAGYITLEQVPAQVNADWNATEGVAEILNKPVIPTVPTDVSAFNNDVGYITGCVETDPQFNAWDKDYNDLINTPEIPTVPTDVSAFTNDAHYVSNAACEDVDLCALAAALAQLQALVEEQQQRIEELESQISDTTTVTATLPTVITGAVSDITETTATCGGEVTADGGAAVTERGVCWSTLATPTVADAHTSDGTGTGTFTSSITGLTANTTYYVRAYATNSVGTGYGEVVTFTTEAATPAGDGQPCPGAVTITDYDGNVYNTVQIGDQCWTRENLRTTHYADGTPIPAGGDGWDDASDTEPYYYDYSRSGILLAERGYHYNWSAAMHGASSSSAIPSGVQGVCPTGWHLPSDAEWTVLTDYVGANFACGGDSSYIAKALASTTWWESYSFECCPGDQSVTANNTTGFGAVPAGIWITAYDEAGYYAGFWSSTELDSYYANYRDMFGNSTNVGSGYSAMAGSKEDGLSVRCLRDSVGGGETSVTLPTVTTDMVSDITANTANCGGNVISDGGATVIVRGVCWSTYQYPTVGNNHTTDGSGMGIFNSSITGLSTNITYYVRAYATNSEGTAYGEVVTFTTEAAPPAGNGQPCPSTPTVTDYDGNVYNTVQIGDQCWTRENLRVTHYSDGMPIPAGGDNMSNTEPFYYDYSSSGIPLSDRGYLYNWPAAMHGAASSSAVSSWVQGVCPTGWHLPGDAEWTALGDYVGANYACGGETYKIAKALASTTGWNTSTTSCAPGNDQSTNNASGFGAVPAGCYSYGNNDWYGSTDYHRAGYNTTFWSPTEYDSYGAYGSTLNYNGVHVYRSGIYGKTSGLSVRCLRDEDGTDTTQTTLPTVITGAVSDITETTATCGGEVTADGGAAVTERGVCWSTSATPTVADAHTSDGTGIGTFTSSITALTANTTYYVRAYATNSVGTGYGEAVTFTTEVVTPAGDGQPCPAAPTVTDHEGNVYATVQIGGQCWMRDNLRTTTSPTTGTNLIPASGTGPTCSGKQACWYDNDPITYAPQNYGLLYNWNAAVDTFNTSYGETSVNQDWSNAVNVSFTSNRRGICPAGWHLPSDAEWTQLTNYVSSQSEYTCSGNSIYIAKALASTTGWYYDADECDSCSVATDQSLNNASGFSAVPAGSCGGSSFDSAGNHAYFWSSTQYGSEYAYGRSLYYSYAGVSRLNYYKGNGYSVRCLRD